MKTTRAFWISLVGVMAVGATALAKPVVSGSAPITPLPKATTLADNVVVSGQGAAPAAQPVQVQPVQQAPAQPVVVDPGRREVVHDVSEPHNYMGTIAVSALMGGVAGALIGGAIYYLDNQSHPWNIAYWAAGGVLVGTGVGLTQILIQESRASQATASMPTDPAPTFRLALYRTHF